MARSCITFVVLVAMSLFCSVLGSGLRGSPQDPGPQPGSPTPVIPGTELQAILDEYGSLIAGGELFDLPGPQYTWDGFVEGVNLYNYMAMEGEQRLFLSEEDVTLNTRTLFVLMAHLQFETAQWNACKERLRNADGSCPADDGGGCSAGRVDSYTPEGARQQGFLVTDCNGVEAPPNGCIDAWGRALEDPSACWFGRGATQLTWPANYGRLQGLVQAAAGVDICNDPDRLCDDEVITWLTAIAYWMMEDDPWRAAYTFDSSLRVIRPEDPSSNDARRQRYEGYLEAAGLPLVPPTLPTLPPQPSGTTTVQPGEGCFQIAERVCGSGGNWAGVICNPPACNPPPGLGQEVEYDCNGC
jgi:hypothetical protein